MVKAFAYIENNGTLDLDSISYSIEGVKYKVLEGCMGWRFQHPDLYCQIEEWKRMLTYGKVLEVEVNITRKETNERTTPI